jgi:tRNA-binding EMAP/Myf-like protein
MSGQIVTAQIKKITAHPDAKKLRICTVNDGSEDLQIVCGAANAREGMITVLAQVGSVLPSGLKIEKAALRGIDSFGMLCSAKELGLIDEGGIVDLPPSTKLGQAYNVLDQDIFSSIPWYSFEEKEAFWQSKNSRDILITRNGQTPKDINHYQIISKTYWNDGQYRYRNFN